jgi:hypothetical protein
MPRDQRPPTIWEALAERLGRDPTNQEAAEECRRIMREAAEERRASPRSARR